MQYMIRIGGTADFVSKIDPDDQRSIPPGSVDVVPGWEHPDILKFDTEEEANTGASEVERIEGFSTDVLPAD